jgi:beta-glucosidase
VVESSVHDLRVGSSSSDIRQRGALRVRGERIPPRDLSAPTRAENFDAYSGVRLVDESKVRGTAVGSVGAGDWISFAGSRTTGGPATFTAQVAATTAGSMQVRLDSPTGPLLGTATVASTGSAYTYATTTAPLSAAAGIHDVYLVFSPGVRLSTFTIR